MATRWMLLFYGRVCRGRGDREGADRDTVIGSEQIAVSPTVLHATIHYI